MAKDQGRDKITKEVKEEVKQGGRPPVGGGLRGAMKAKETKRGREKREYYSC